jgi:hypothetical protein
MMGVSGETLHVIALVLRVGYRAKLGFPINFRTGAVGGIPGKRLAGDGSRQRECDEDKGKQQRVSAH